MRGKVRDRGGDKGSGGARGREEVGVKVELMKSSLRSLDLEL